MKKIICGALTFAIISFGNPSIVKSILDKSSGTRYMGNDSSGKMCGLTINTTGTDLYDVSYYYVSGSTMKIGGIQRRIGDYHLETSRLKDTSSSNAIHIRFDEN